MNKVIILCDANVAFDQDSLISNDDVIILRQQTSSSTNLAYASNDTSCSSSAMWRLLSPHVFNAFISVLRLMPAALLDSATAHTILHFFSDTSLGKNYIAMLRCAYGCESNMLSAYQFIHGILLPIKMTSTCESVVDFSTLRSIEYNLNEVTVTATTDSTDKEVTYKGSCVVIATSPSTWKEITFAPTLATPLREALTRITTGHFYSAKITYITAHWRSISAYTLPLMTDCSTGPVCFIEESLCNHDRYSLRVHTGGIPAQLLLDVTSKQRRELILQQLAHYFGPQSLEPQDFTELNASASEPTDEWEELPDTQQKNSIFPTGVISVLREAPLPERVYFAHADIGVDLAATVRNVLHGKKTLAPVLMMQRFLLLMTFGFGVAVVFFSLLYLAMLIFPAVFQRSNITVLQDTCSTNAMR